MAFAALAACLSIWLKHKSILNDCACFEGGRGSLKKQDTSARQPSRTDSVAATTHGSGAIQLAWWPRPSISRRGSRPPWLGLILTWPNFIASRLRHRSFVLCGKAFNRAPPSTKMINGRASLSDLTLCLGPLAWVALWQKNGNRPTVSPLMRRMHGQRETFITFELLDNLSGA